MPLDDARPGRSEDLGWLSYYTLRRGRTVCLVGRYRLYRDDRPQARCVTVSLCAPMYSRHRALIVFFVVRIHLTLLYSYGNDCLDRYLLPVR